jgi:hypothetical protein
MIKRVILVSLPYSVVLIYDTYNLLVWASLGYSLASLFVPDSVDRRGLVRLVMLLIAAILPALKGMTAEEALAYAFVLYSSAPYLASLDFTRKDDRPDLQAMEDAFDCYVRGDTGCVRAKVDEAKRLLASWDPQVNEPYKSLIKAMSYPDPRGRPAARDVANWLNGVT